MNNDICENDFEATMRSMFATANMKKTGDFFMLLRNGGNWSI